MLLKRQSSYPHKKIQMNIYLVKRYEWCEYYGDQCLGVYSYRKWYDMFITATSMRKAVGAAKNAYCNVEGKAKLLGPA